MTSKKDELKWKKVEKLKVFWTGWKYKRSCNKKEHPSLQQLSLEFIYLLHNMAVLETAFTFFSWRKFSLVKHQCIRQRNSSTVEARVSCWNTRYTFNKGLTGNDN